MLFFFHAFVLEITLLLRATTVMFIEEDINNFYISP